MTYKVLEECIWSRIVPNDYKRIFSIPEIQGDVMVGKLIGEGSFSQVFNSEKHGEKIALKIIPKDRLLNLSNLNNLENELQTLRLLSHKNIVGLQDTKQNSKFIILTFEFCDSDLLNILKDCSYDSSELKRELIRDICPAVQYMHSLNIFHRDIKPENILKKNNVYKLSDFGLAFHTKNYYINNSAGSLGFVAPEVLSYDDYDIRYIDQWSMGCTLLEVWISKEKFKEWMWLYKNYTLKFKMLQKKCDIFINNLPLLPIDIQSALRIKSTERILPNTSSSDNEIVTHKYKFCRNTLYSSCNNFLRPKSILIIEDSKTCARMLECLIRNISKRCHIDIAYDGLLGINLTKTNFYDFIFLDIQMPKKSGIEFLNTLVEYEANLVKYKKPKICILSSVSTTHDRAFYTITKPVSKKQISEIFKRNKKMNTSLHKSKQ